MACPHHGPHDSPSALAKSVLLGTMIVSGVGACVRVTQATVYTKKHVFRAEDVEDNLYAAIDKVADKLARKLRKTKERAKKVKGSPTAREV